MVLVLLGLCMVADSVQAKGLELTGYGGAILGGRVGVREGDINIVDGASYGLTLSFDLQRSMQAGVLAELYYKRQDAQLELETWPDERTTELFDMSVEYFHFGVLRQIRPGRVAPYVVGSLGATRLAPKVQGVGDEWIFSVGAGGGVRAMSPTGRFGIRIDMRLLLPLDFAGGGIFCSSASGCSAGIGAGVIYAQFDMSGGITVAF
jgi:hypothetical protein